MKFLHKIRFFLAMDSLTAAAGLEFINILCVFNSFKTLFSFNIEYSNRPHWKVQLGLNNVCHFNSRWVPVGAVVFIFHIFQMLFKKCQLKYCLSFILNSVIGKN